MKKLNQYKHILFSGLLLLVLAANSASAALVPCGGQGQSACTLCDFLRMAKNLIDFFVEAAVVLAVLFIVWGGFVIMIAGGSPERVSQGRKTITIAVTGVAIALGGWLIIGTLFNIISGGSPLPWNQIQCR